MERGGANGYKSRWGTGVGSKKDGCGRGKGGGEGVVASLYQENKGVGKKLDCLVSTFITTENHSILRFINLPFI